MSKIFLREFGHMGRILLALALTVSILAGLGLAVQDQVRAQGDEVVSIDPADTQVTRGETFTVDVAIAEAENLWSYEFTLTFDPTLVEFVSVEDASFLGSTGREVVQAVDPGEGTVTFTALTTGEADGPDGPGTLATVTLKAVGLGTSALELQNVSVFSGLEERVPTVEDGSVTSVLAMAIDPETSLVNLGEFAVDVMIHGAVDLTSYAFNLGFNPDVLQVVDVDNGPFLGSTGRTPLPGEPQIDNAAGTVFFGAVSVGTDPGPDDDGILATVTFEAVDFGDSELTLFDLEAFSGLTAETPIAMDGMVYVLQAGVSVVPEASSMSRCDTFEVELALGGDVEDLTGFDVNLAWDPALFEVEDIAFHPYMESTGRQAQELGKSIDNVNGTLNYGVATFGDQLGPDAPGVLAVVELRAIEVGTSDLELFDVLISFDGFDVAPAALFDGTAQAWPEADSFTFSTIDSPQVAGEPFMVTITAVDADGDPVQHFSGDVELSDTTGTLSPTTVEFVDGEPAVTAEVTITKAEDDILITAEGENPCEVAIDGQSNAFDVEPNVPYSLTLEADPAELMVGETSVLTATVMDEYGNLVADGTEVVFETDLGALSDELTTTDGVATAALTSETSGTATVTATAGDASDDVEVVFNPGAPATLTLEADPAELMVGETSVLTATVMDAYGNLVADGTEVVFETDLGVLSDELTTTDGVATAALTSETSGTATVTATAGDASDDVEVVFNPGPAVSVTIDPEAETLEIGQCVTFTLMAEDSYGNTFDVTDQATFTVNGVELDANEFCAETAGEFIVTGTYLTLSADATVTVEPDAFHLFLPIVARNYTP